MGGLLNRPLAGTLMGALALSTSLASGSKDPPLSYFEEAPSLINPTSRLALGSDIVANNPATDPFQVQNGAGAYVVKIPLGITSIRVKAWGASGGSSGGNSQIVAVGGFIQGDIKVAPGEVLFCIVGLEGRNHNGNNSYNINAYVRPNQIALGGPGLYADNGNGPQVVSGGGFSAIFRLTQDIINKYSIREPYNANYARYPYLENIPAIVNEALPLIVVGGGGGSGYRQSSSGYGVPGGKGGYPKGEDTDGQLGITPATGGTQTAGGERGGGVSSSTTFDPVTPAQNGSKWIGGSISGNSPAGAGGGGYYGGGAGRQTSYSSVAHFGPGAGGSNYMDARYVFNPIAPTYGRPVATDTETPKSTISGDYTSRGKLVFQWDTPA